MESLSLEQRLLKVLGFGYFRIVSKEGWKKPAVFNVSKALLYFGI